MPMPAKNTATIVKPIIALLCGGTANSPQFLFQKFLVVFGHFEISVKQEMIGVNARPYSPFLKTGIVPSELFQK